MPAIQTFTASRNATWAPTLVYPYPGPALPLTGATIAMQLRLYEGQPGDALLTLAAIEHSDALVSGTAGQPDEVRWLTLSPSIASDQLEALPAGTPTGDPTRPDAITFAFDIRITFADEVSEILSSGTFTLTSGVTTA